MTIEQYKELFDEMFVDLIVNTSIENDELLVVLKPLMNFPKVSLGIAINFTNKIEDDVCIKLKLYEFGNNKFKILKLNAIKNRRI
ncbi:hypothetical protein FA048_12860 [Pedobacter polaris]|uniref:Uncharacterized protein n=1 Tax=Pedobacter polaris TaxID=2571273 RepID=A0A4U1CN91_9SPHI|nr:hypothetical protein [Pedobacter polaris]TKC08048.1 hypothetical protein FA048_12860 [Pedobacter polaris]